MTELRALTMLNDAGDETIVWTEESDGTMREVIEKKMAEGVAFFIIEPRAFGLLPPIRRPVETIDEAMEARAISMRDEDFRALILGGSAQVTKTPAKKINTVRRAETADDVVKNQSVGVKPMKGG